jgi:protein-disulfide isomerase
LLFDYTCPQCRFLHGLLPRCLRRYGAEQIAFVLLPVPLESRCNPAITVVEPGREGACEYARLALAVWQAAPERFAEFDAFLAEGANPPAVAVATKRARELIGSARLDALLAAGLSPEGSRVDAVLRQGVAVYEEAGLGVLPKLLFSRVVIAGQPSNITELYEALEQHLGIEMSP